MIRRRVIFIKETEICRERVNWMMEKEKKKRVTQIMNLKGNRKKENNIRDNRCRNKNLYCKVQLKEE